MKAVVYWIGVIVVVVLLVSSGILGGALCVRNVGCVFSSDGGVSVDSRTTVTVDAR